ncbi:hypothetical protein [Actinomadura sp. NTSP31]|uniref:hypothetical protein n=1 Tax=Actinomadura sp. NTSP31 TaxID=1735447 RepID=UPI0035C0355B
MARPLRRGLIDTINRVLRSEPWSEMLHRGARSSDPIEARRATWVLDEAARDDVPEGRYAIRVVVPDPNLVRVEARVMVDGTPVVVTAFDKGPAKSPEDLVHSGRLKATSDPREVMLAKAHCAEGCSGGLYTTIVREKAEVVWKDWRSSMPGDPPQDVRFDAAEYDRELARAAHDHGWEWPARAPPRRSSADGTARPDGSPPGSGSSTPPA